MGQVVRRAVSVAACLAALLVVVLVAPAQAADAPSPDLPPSDRSLVVGKATMALGGLLLGTVLLTRTRRRTTGRR